MKFNRSRKQAGFTLIEMLIVIAIILVIVAIAVPSYLRSQQAAAQSQGAADARTLYTGIRTYENMFPLGSATAPPANFTPLTLAMLGNGGTAGYCANGPVPTATAACVINDSLSSGTVGSYSVAITTPLSADGSNFTIQFSPLNPTTNYAQSMKWFQISGDGTLYYSTNQGTTWQSL
jgi:type IV pilus assembly protein PilA